MAGFGGPGPEHENVEVYQEVEDGPEFDVCDDCGAIWNEHGEGIAAGDGSCADLYDERL